MSLENLPIILISFECSPSWERLSEILKTISGDLSPDRLRLYEQGLLVVRCTHPIDERVVQRLGMADDIRRIRILSPGERLYTKGQAGHHSPVKIGENVQIGNVGPCILAGPCSVENENQLVTIAQRVQKAGASILRAGAFKPRTSPYEFAGMGKKGLEDLVACRNVTGLPFVTEVLDPEHLDHVAEHADMLQIGSRNMHNASLLFKVGAHPSGKPILLKRGLGAKVKELLEAAEYVLLGRFHAGIDEPRLVLCERGIRTFDDVLRFTLDVGAIAYLKKETHLPIIADPSHAAGKREFVAPLALAALAAGADGLLIEVHADPDAAWSDGFQSLGFEAFESLMDQIST